MLGQSSTSISDFLYLVLLALGNAAAFVFFIYQYLKPRYHWLVSLSLLTIIVLVLSLFRDIIPAELRVGLLSPLLLVLFTALLFYGSFKRKLVISGTCYLGVLVIESVTALIMFVMHLDYTDLINSVFFNILYNVIILPAFMILLAMMMRPGLKTDSKFSKKGDGAISFMVFIAAIAIALLLCFVAALHQYNVTTFITACLNICLTTGSLLLVFYLLIRAEEALAREKEQVLLHRSYELALKRAEQATTYRKEIDALQSRMCHILDDIVQQTNDNDVPAAIAVIRENIDMVQNIKRTKRYPNGIADYLISQTEKACTEQKIAFDVEYALPQNIGIDEMDFCVVLSNVLDNAHKACQEPSEERFIHLSLHKNDNIVFIGCQNTFPKEKNVLKPYRRLGSFGLRNIREIAAKYQGDVQISMDKETFAIKILLYGNDVQYLVDA